MYGLPEIRSDLMNTLSVDELSEGFEHAWLEHCRHYSVSAAEQDDHYGTAWGHLAAKHDGDANLARRAWEEFSNDEQPDTAAIDTVAILDGLPASGPWTSVLVDGRPVMAPVAEAGTLSTDTVSLYGIAAIQNLALLCEEHLA